MSEQTGIGGLTKIIVDTAAAAVFTAIGGAVLNWLGLSVNGAICGGAILGLPAFVAVHGFLTNREMRKRLATLESRLSLPAPAMVDTANASHSGGGRGGHATASGRRATAIGGSGGRGGPGGTGDDGGNVNATSDLGSIAIGGNAGSAGNADGSAGRGGESAWPALMAAIAAHSPEPEKVTPENQHKVAMPISPLGVMVYAGSGMNPRRGITIIRTFGVTFDRIGLLPDLYRLACRVEFVGLVPGAGMSPASLLVTAKGGSPRIAILETSDPPSPQGEKTYTADVKPEDLRPCLIRPGGGSTDIWPPQPGTLCDVEIRLPRGEALAMHGRSATAVDFELSAGEQFRPFLAPIEDITRAPNKIDGRSMTLDEVRESRRFRIAQAKVTIKTYIANIEQARRDDPTWLSKRSNLDPEWTHWIRLERVPLWQAVCLSFDIDPDKLPNASAGTADLRKLMVRKNSHLDPGRNYFKERLQEAGAHFQVPLDGTVSLPEFASWAIDDAEWRTWPQEFAVLSGSTKAIDLS